MNKDLDLWRFIRGRLEQDQAVMLLVVTESSGSSPGRSGYKMAVAMDGELSGSIGGGVMEVRIVEQARARLSEPEAAWSSKSAVNEQIHRTGVANSSGMICSGRQTVILKQLTVTNIHVIDAAIDALITKHPAILKITQDEVEVLPPAGQTPDADFQFEKSGDTKFSYFERFGPKHRLIIIGGGHCALALSELMSRMDFRISIFDDRPDLNTIDKNRFAEQVTIINDYKNIGTFIDAGTDVYVVVMTLGYKSDEVVIRSLFDRDFKYFGVLGSRAKMKTLLKSLKNEGFSEERLALIRTPIGLPINSRTPEEIAVSIAAQIISVKNR